MTNPSMPPELRKAMKIIQKAQVKNKDGWVSEKEPKRMCAKLLKLGITVVTATKRKKAPAKNNYGRSFVEVSIHPFVVQLVDEDGEPLVKRLRSNASGGEYSDKFGDELDGYPDTMFRKGWSVTSWIGTHGGDADEVDNQEFCDYDAAIARAEELSEKYNVGIDHRY